MTHTLYLTAIANPDRLMATRLIRAAMADLGTPGAESDTPTYADADAVIEAFARDGHALLGTVPHLPFITNVKNRLAEGKVEAQIDYEPDEPRNVRRLQSRADAEAGKTPEEVFAERAPGSAAEPEPRSKRETFSTSAHETAMLLIVMCDGNPTNAAGYCYSLARTTEDDDLYRETQAALVQVFPFVARPLDESGMRLP